MSSEQIPVLICRDCQANTADFVLEKADKEHIASALKPILAKDAILCSDSGKALGAAARELGITHRPIHLAAGVRVIMGVYLVQNVNAYDYRLKEWMRRFLGVATRYLGNYLGWRRLVERHRDALSPSAILRAALGMIPASDIDKGKDPSDCVGEALGVAAWTNNLFSYGRLGCPDQGLCVWPQREVVT